MLEFIGVGQTIASSSTTNPSFFTTVHPLTLLQLRNAPGGIEDAIQDMGDMVKELPLKEVDSLCTANFTATADQNSTDMAAAGRMNWTKGQVNQE